MLEDIKTVGFFRRFFAYLLDFQIFLIIAVGIFLVNFSYFTTTMSVQPYAPGETINLLMIFLIALFLLFLGNFFYIWLFTKTFGATIGKMLFGIKIIKSDGSNLDKSTAFWRMTAGYAASTTFFGLGYLSAFKKHNLTWHDKIFDTKVIKIRNSLVGILFLFVLVPIILFVETYLILNLSGVNRPAPTSSDSLQIETLQP